MKCNSVPFPGFHKIWHTYIREVVRSDSRLRTIASFIWESSYFIELEIHLVLLRLAVSDTLVEQLAFNSYSPNWEVADSTLKSRPEHFHSSLWIWAVALAWTVRKQTWDTPEYCAIEIMQNATRTPLDRQLFDNTTCSGHSIKGSGWPKTLF